VGQAPRVDQLLAVVDALQAAAADRPGWGALASQLYGRLTALAGTAEADDEPGTVDDASARASAAAVLATAAEGEADAAPTSPSKLEPLAEPVERAARLRLLVRAVAALVLLNSKRSTGLVRTDPASPLNSGNKAARALQQLAPQALPHPALLPAARWAAAFCASRANTLTSSPSLVAQLGACLFPDAPWLQLRWLQPSCANEPTFL
jgi:hypothetical protein